MSDSWGTRNTDKLILLFLVVLLWIGCLCTAVHIFHHDPDNMGAIAFITFMTGSVTTVLGALVAILRADVTFNPPNHPPPQSTPNKPLDNPPPPSV